MADTPLITATYGLVVATGLLVIATAIPAYQRYREGRAERLGRAMKLVPDMNMLHSRLRGQLATVVRMTGGDLDSFDRMIYEHELNAEYLARLVKGSYDVGLRFANELYVSRHLLTQAADNLRYLARQAEKVEGRKSDHDLTELPHSHVDHAAMSTEARLQHIAAYIKAAEMSLQTAETLLPKASRTIDGEPFWDRYRKLIDSRVTEAEKALVDMRRHSRS